MSPSPSLIPRPLPDFISQLSVIFLHSLRDKIWEQGYSSLKMSSPCAEQYYEPLPQDVLPASCVMEPLTQLEYGQISSLGNRCFSKLRNYPLLPLLFATSGSLLFDGGGDWSLWKLQAAPAGNSCYRLTLLCHHLRNVRTDDHIWTICPLSLPG